MKIYMQAFAIFLFFSCNNAWNSNETNSRTADADSLNKTAALHSMKGFELYVWKKEQDTFYTLLPGTNRNKTAAEIFDSKKAVKGMKAVKNKIDQIAPGEYVFVKAVELDTTAFSALQEYMKSRQLVVATIR